ncbi:MAG: beta-ketoacyl-ACP synthase III [Sphaerochaetaceae bacterium]|jgi:3-oxoacyl-[acyl-carrier-protein] synthase-3
MVLKNVTIEAVGAYLPPKKVTNDDLAKTIDTSDEWIFSHTGIKSRHLAERDVATSDLATESVRNLFSKYNVNPSEIGAIIVATATQDYIGFPATACVVQDKLNLNKIPAFDIAAGCTGFIYALEVGRAMVASSSIPSALIIGSEKLSAVVDWNDRNSCVLFGDGAASVLIKSSEDNNRGIIDTIMYAEGSGAHYLKIPQGGTQKPYDPLSSSQTKLQMEGRSVYNFAVKVLTEVILELLERNNLTIDQIDWIVPHQANSRIITAAANRLKIDQQKFFINIDEHANTSAASIPIALNEMVEKNILNKGDLVMTIGFGAGLTYGGNLIKW